MVSLERALIYDSSLFLHRTHLEVSRDTFSSCSAECTTQVPVMGQGSKRCGQLDRITSRHEPARVAYDLRHRVDPRSDDGESHCHGLKRRETEALAPAGLGREAKDVALLIKGPDVIYMVQEHDAVFYPEVGSQSFEVFSQFAPSGDP